MRVLELGFTNCPFPMAYFASLRCLVSLGLAASRVVSLDCGGRVMQRLETLDLSGSVAKKPTNTQIKIDCRIVRLADARD